jgi:hypothetical protein
MSAARVKVGGRLRLVQRVHLADVGRVRVAWSATWAEFQVRATAPDGGLMAEYFTDDRADALATADRMLDAMARHARMPA